MNKEYKDYFNSIAPATGDSEFLDRVLRKAEAMENNKKHINFKKPLIAACAAVAALGVGVSAAAATGLIDLSSIFAGKVIAHNNTIGENILANVDDFSFATNDEDYTMSLDGVTGTESSIVGSFTIRKTDGTAIYKPSTTIEPLNWGNTSDASIPQYESSGSSHHMSMTVDENGNINGFFELITTNNVDIIGSTVVFNFDGITNGVATLPLAMSGSFTYNPNATSTETVKITDTDRQYTQTMRLGDEKADVTYDIIDSDFTCIGGYINVNYSLPSAPTKDNIWITDYDDQSVTIILNNNTEVSAIISSTMGSRNYLTNISTDTLYIEYRDEALAPITAVNTADIAAVRINGTVFDIA